MVNIRKSLEFLLNPRNLAVIALALLPSTGISAVKEKPQAELKAEVNVIHTKKGNDYLKQSERPLLRSEEKAALYTRANSEFEKAIALNPDDSKALLGMGKVQLKVGACYEAVSYLQKAIALSKNQESLEALTYAYTCVGDFKKAEQSVEEMFKKNENPARAYNFKGYVLYQKGDHKSAMDNLKKAVQIKPDFYEALNSIGVVYDELGNYDEAVSFTQRALYINPKYPNARYSLGLIYKKAGQLEKAQKELEKAVELSPDAENFINALGEVKYLQKK